jgi:two-component sensor histidine kinase
MYREFMEDIKNEVDRENQIITELLTLVRMDRKDSKLNIKECNVNEMCELILRRVRPIAQKRDIELTMVSMREVYAEIDETKMTMVITNLVENAVKYNRDHGKVRLTINADPYNFYISVEDTGVGIPQDSLDKIYDRFYRVDKSRSREVGGTGLGLSITKSIILQHHGAIDVQSILGEGTKFTVTVPLTYVAHPVELRRQRGRVRKTRENAADTRKRSASPEAPRKKSTGAAPAKKNSSAKSGQNTVTTGNGKKPASAKAAGSKTAGSKQAGSRPAGSRPTGSKQSGNRTAGSKQAGSNSTVSKPSGSKPSRSGQAENKSAGSKTSQAGSAGSKTSRSAAVNKTVTEETPKEKV